MNINQTPIRILAFGALLALTSFSFASSPAAWAAHKTEVVSQCVQISGLKNAKLQGDLIEYDDRVGFTAAIITGVTIKPHMKTKGRVLCLFDRRTRAAYASSMDALK